jgi:hypothetical protein
MFEEPAGYRSYLLTMWEERSEDPKMASSWRFRLEDPRGGKRRSFTSLKALFKALKDEMEHLNHTGI